ncbi:HET-domain-containing protein [Mollisia scopiformis]|uniref:HET-domain-containing protein n=1 Tax=Mollisia scopiformis TaxID=149040 RepID=A0A194X0H1_MOLSC|nr:HET-domain-containing protein [Mollisia scopiformis]KUJ13698.1 HET-domain-containing protein [Mollisia scopiformis]
MSTIPPYTYTKLDESRQEIRLISVLPSDNHIDQVRLKILHVPFKIKEKKILWEKPDIDAINLTLPQDWVAHETIEGRVLFYCMEKEEDDYPTVTWQRPYLYIADDEMEEVHFRDSNYMIRDADTFEPRFDALSYTWGSFAEVEIACVVGDDGDGVEGAIPATGDRSLEITENLAVALKHLRYSDRPRLIWVDAICINQQDVEERNEQVLRMSDLYKHADQVVVWLGTSSSNSAKAFEILEHVGKQIEYTIDTYVVRSPEADPFADWSDFDYSPFDVETWKTIRDLITRPWFERVWVVQEIQLANSRAILQCGKDRMRWYYFRRGIICLRNKIQHIPESMIERVLAVGKMCDPLLGWSLPDLLVVSSFKKCINPLDKVYGVLALAPEGFANTLKPDYALSPIDGYRATFLEYTFQSQRLSLLHHCHSNQPDKDWPSWVPDWSNSDKETLDFYLHSHASGDSSAHWRYSKPHILRAAGVQVTTVSYVSKWLLTPKGDVDGFISELGLEKMRSLRDPTGLSLLDAYLHVMCRGQFEETMDVPDTPAYLALEDIRTELLEGSSSRNSVLMDPDLRWKSKRRVILTERGYMGMAPEHVKEGDIVCILLGSNLPTILRPDATSTRFNIVGHSYIHGLMNGEALLGPVSRPWRSKRRMNWRGVWEACFEHEKTEQLLDVAEDPRLYSVPDEWERLENDDPHHIQKWKNTQTGEIINSDPRLLPDALVERGVMLQMFIIT